MEDVKPRRWSLVRSRSETSPNGNISLLAVRQALPSFLSFILFPQSHHFTDWLNQGFTVTGVSYCLQIKLGACT
jgi:hypothetical protein